MSDQVCAKAQAQQKTLSGSSPKSNLLQRTCACGQHTISGAECSTCRSEQSTVLRSQRVFEPPSAPGAVPGSSPAQENVPSFNSAFDRASRFGHDFSQISIHPPAAGAIQTKLAINKPGDEYEQEADRVAEQVMRMPEPPSLAHASPVGVQRKCATCASGNGLCPKCAEEEKVQRQPLLSRITSFIQRQVMGARDGEEEIQRKPLAGTVIPLVQRQLQAKPNDLEVGPSTKVYAKVPVKIQTKLTVNTPGDVYEREVDQIADRVMATLAHTAVSTAPPHIQRFAGQPTGPAEAAPASVDNALASPGTPLEPTLRQDMEQRFGYDFSRVRVHSGAAAEQSARDVNAHAYTVGHDMVFGAGRFIPGTREGRRLIAHELTHVLQQAGVDGIRVGQSSRTRSLSPMFARGENALATTSGTQLLANELAHVVQQADATRSPLLLRKPEDCPPDRVDETDHPGDCPEIVRDKKELERAKAFGTSVETIVPGECYLLANLKTGSTKFGSPKKFEEVADFLQLDLGLTLHITGFTDCLGTAEENADLRMNRAFAVEEYFTSVLRVDPQRIVVEIASPSEYIAANDTPEGRSRNRSVALYLEAPRTTICPPLSNNPATTLDDYIDLIRCAERVTGYTPREMLAMLRQMYFGKDWSAASQTNRWDKVITCSPNLGNPRSLLGSELFGALWSSATVQGVDVRHIFTGLEAMTCPKSTVTVSILLPLGTVQMENEAFATWGGDVAAAAAAMVACWDMEDAERATSGDCSNEPTPGGLPFYFKLHAPPGELEGDIDAFVIRAAELGVPCVASAMQAFNPSRLISEMFADYYHNAGASGKTHSARYRCFVEAIGGRVVGNRIDNRKDLIVKLGPAIESFAETYYFKIMKAARGYGGPGTEARIIAHGTSVTRLQQHSWNALELLFDWVDAHL